MNDQASKRGAARLPRLLGGRRREAAREEPTSASSGTRIVDPPVDLEPHDPLLAYLESHPQPVDLSQLKLDSPGVTALRAAGVRMVVPLLAQGELIGVIHLGERLSEQEYSSEDRRLLETLAGHAAPALRVAQLVREQEEEVRRRERYEQEMRVAQLIQQTFLPKELPQRHGWYFHAFYRPAREVGGDFYDFIEFDDGGLGVVVADVTDKGMPAALVMASARGVLRAAAQRLRDPGVVLARVNDQIQPDMPPHMFVTCLYGVLEPDSGRFRFANAGHNLPCAQTDAGAEEVRATGMPLGLLPGMAYEENELTLPPGRSLLLYSDALPEAHGPDGDMYGFPRLIEAVGANPGGAELLDRLLDDLEGFTGPGWEQEDDITLVVVERSLAPLEHPGEDAGHSERSRVLAAFSVPSEPGREREAMDRVAAAIDGVAVPVECVERMKTAVAEAVMNAIEHGNQQRPELPVDVEVRIAGDALTIRVTDRALGGAVPADPEEPDLAEKLRGAQSPRGWGLFLIKRMVDDLRVRERDGRQEIELVFGVDGASDG